MAAPLWGNGDSLAGASDTSYSISVTPANSNRVLYAFVNSANTTAPTSVVFNTTETMTEIASGTYDTGTRGWWLYRLIAPSATTANVVFSFAAAATRKVSAWWYYDVDQTTPNDAADAATGSGTAVQNTVASETGDTCFAIVGHTATATHAPASGETERIDPGNNHNALYELAGGASLSFDVTLGTSRPWVCVGVNLNAVAAGAGFTPRLTLLGVG